MELVEIDVTTGVLERLKTTGLQKLRTADHPKHFALWDLTIISKPPSTTVETT